MPNNIVSFKVFSVPPCHQTIRNHKGRTFFSANNVDGGRSILVALPWWGTSRLNAQTAVSRRVVGLRILFLLVAKVLHVGLSWGSGWDHHAPKIKPFCNASANHWQCRFVANTLQSANHSIWTKLRMQESVNYGTHWPLSGIGICVGSILTSIQDDKDDQCLVPAHSRMLERRARCNFILGFQDVRWRLCCDWRNKER